MSKLFFVSDLHGAYDKYHKLAKKIKEFKPEFVLLGGDLLPPSLPLKKIYSQDKVNFITEFLTPLFSDLQIEMAEKYPEVMLIMGNDDPAFFEPFLENSELWNYLHNRTIISGELTFCGYNFVPPSPFFLKDWERYDVSRYSDPGTIDLEDGVRSIQMSEHDIKWTTISEDLSLLSQNLDADNTVFLFHTPPYNCSLDLGELNGKMIDYVPIDEHLGSIAVRRFIEDFQPKLTLHGHIHESTRMSGVWKEQFDLTVSINGASEGELLTLVIIDSEKPESAERLLV